MTGTTATATTPTTTGGTGRRSTGSGLGRVAGWVVAVVGAVMLLGGATTWGLVQNQLAAENITVAEDARWFAGDPVDGPLTAFSQADIINHHSLEMSDGLTYAELDREDPLRATVMNGSFLRASLFTSVLAFGVSLLAMGVGASQVLVGAALVRGGSTA